jgi:putative transposase
MQSGVKPPHSIFDDNEHRDIISSMKHWPHSPTHRLDTSGAFMVTAGTYGKKYLFNTTERLQLLHDTLLENALEFGWKLQAWAVLSNHYHFIAISPDNTENLKKFISKLHTLTAIQINRQDGMTGRRVWFQYWDSNITYHNSYLTRLNYVHNNPTHHGIIDDSSNYPWCSSAWFSRTADSTFYKTVQGLKTDLLKVPDDF